MVGNMCLHESDASARPYMASDKAAPKKVATRILKAKDRRNERYGCGGKKLVDATSARRPGTAYHVYNILSYRNYPLSMISDRVNHSRKPLVGGFL